MLESSNFKFNEDINPTRADRVDKLYDTKYFIIKSLNHQNIRLSIEKGIWATQIMNERILDDAFHVRDRFFLISNYAVGNYYIYIRVC